MTWMCEAFKAFNFHKQVTVHMLCFLGDALPPSVTDLIASTPELEDIDDSAYPRTRAARYVH